MSMDFRHREKKKVSKSSLEKKAKRELSQSSWELPRVEIIKKGKRDDA